MKVTSQSLSGLLLIEPRVFSDSRGYFKEVYQAERFAQCGLPAKFVQDNYSRSVKNTVRGLHYQIPNAQGKLIWAVRGEIFDVAVDLRRHSPTFGSWLGFHLSDSNHHQLYIPPGFAHGFCVLSEFADVAYKCTQAYHAESEQTIQWNDRDLAISWPVTDPILSPKDAQATPFRNAICFEEV